MKTATKISKKLVPLSLLEVLKAHNLGATMRVSIVVVHDSEFRISTYDTQWGGGSRNVYHVSTIGSDVLTRIHAVEGGRLEVPAGSVVVVDSVFCGKQYEPAIYINNADLPSLFRLPIPDDMKGIDSAVVADWLEEDAENCCGTSIAKKRRETAALFRQLCAR